ncbi:hypothetical protein ABEX47_26640 [Paenibacillus ehimensis]
MKPILIHFIKKRLAWNVLNFMILFIMLPILLKVELQASLLLGTVVFIIVSLVEMTTMALWGRK